MNKLEFLMRLSGQSKTCPAPKCQLIARHHVFFPGGNKQIFVDNQSFCYSTAGT